MDSQCIYSIQKCIILLFALYFITMTSPTMVEEPVDEGHVSRTDRKYLTKGGYYQRASHYWPFDYETRLRDVKYSINGTLKGTGVSITGKSRGFLKANGHGWVKLGRFKNECLCDARRCRKEGISVSLWVKLSSLDNATKVLLGSDSSQMKNTTGILIFQSTRENGSRFISVLVFMEKYKWKSRFSVIPGTWFYLSVTWKEKTGLRLFKDGRLMAYREIPKFKPLSRRKIQINCAVSLSPPSDGRPLTAYYDDLLIWRYELESRDMLEVYTNSFDPPKVKECKTSDGQTMNVDIDDEDNVYELKGNYKITWKKIGGYGTTISNYTNRLTFDVTGLERSSEYKIEVQRNVSNNVLSRPSHSICNTEVGVPLKPRRFTVREKASTYFLLQWQPPAEVYGIVKGYKISYRIDDFSNSEWMPCFRADVHKSSLDRLKPFTDYIIKLLCRNGVGGGSEVTLRATTAEGVPGPPRRLRVILKGSSLVIKWREPLSMNGMVDYRVVTFFNGSTRTVCTSCGEYHRMANVEQNTTYTFWAIAYNVNNDPRYESKKSNNVTITTPSFTPSVPRSVETKVKFSGIHVLWKPSKFLNGEVHYELLGLVNGSHEKAFCTKCGLRYLVKDVKQNTIYSFWVVAYNVGKGYKSPASPKVNVNTGFFVPSTPMLPTVNITFPGVLVSWKESRVLQGAVQYKLVIEENGSRKVFCSECGLQYLLNNTEPNTNYSFWVIAYNIQNGFESAPSTVVRFRTASQTPSVPRSVETKVKFSGIHVLWKPSKFLNGEVHYELLGLVNGSHEKAFCTKCGLRYLVKDVKQNTIYSFWVVAYNVGKGYKSPASPKVNVNTGFFVPSTPMLPTVNITFPGVLVSWKESRVLQGAVQYKLVIEENGSRKVFCSECGLQYLLNNTEPNTNYSFWVIAYNIQNGFESAPSTVVRFRTASQTPSVPRSVETKVKFSGIHVLWKPSKFLNGEVHYELLGLVNGSHEKAFCTKCGLRYLVKDVKQNTIYSFWVVAYNVGKGYKSPASPKVNVNTGFFVPSTPMLPTVNITSDGVLVSWKESRVLQGAVQYKLVIEENGSRKVFCSECGLQYLLNNTEPNTNYSFWVIAYNIQNGFESAPSTVVRFRTASQKHRVQPPESVVASDVKDSSATVAWKPPKELDQDIVGYLVTLYDAHKILETIKTRNRHVNFTNLNQFSKYYITVQVETKYGYGLPSAQLIIHTKDHDECRANEGPCSKYADCVNSAGSFFCSCASGYVGDGKHCEALPQETTESDFCPEEMARNVTWEETYHGYTDRKLCPNGTIGISTRKCIKGNGTWSYWINPDLSNCVSAWMSELDDKLADRSLNSTAVGNFFLKLLKENDNRGLYGGDVIKSVEVIDILFNKSKDNELHPQQTDSKVAEKFVENLVNITEKIVNTNTLKVWNDIPKDRRAENGAIMVNKLENMVVNSAKIVNYSSIQNENIAVWFGDLAYMESQGHKTSLLDTQYGELNSLKFPKLGRRKRKDVADRTSVAVIKYKTIGVILSAGEEKASHNDDEFVNTAVLSVAMDPPIPTPFQEPFEFLLKNQEEGEFEKPKCVFFNMSRNPGFWSTHGCRVFQATPNFTICHCDHMTSFSVLMQVKHVELAHSHELILGWVTRIGLIISLIALVLAFVTFVCLPRPCGHRNGSKCFKLCDQGYRPTYLKKVRSGIHTNLIFSLAAGEALFLWGIEKTEVQVTCYTVAALLHYLFLVAFHWMAAEGVILYLVLVKVFQRKSSRKDKRMFMLICWGCPAAIVCISLAFGYENYLHENCCWLSITHGLIWSFVGPALAIIMVNVFFLCCTFRVMGKRKRLDKNGKQMSDNIRYWAKGAAIVTCLLGVTWVFGVFFIHSDSVAVAYLFNIFNVFQGLFIFIFHCLLDEKIRQQYYQVFCVVTNGETLSPSHSSGTVKKERRRSTFNSWLWSVVPIKYQDSKSESCPTVAENTLKRFASSTHSLSLSPHVDRTVQEIILGELRPRGMSSIYHDSDENMDNIPDNILTVKHAKTSMEECLNKAVVESTLPHEDCWISTLSRGNSDEISQVPTTTWREECLYEVKEWEEQQGIETERKSLLEQELRKLNETQDSDCESEKDNDCSEEDSITKSVNDSKRDRNNDDCRCYRTSLPQIILSDYSNKNVASTPKCYKMVKLTESSGTEIGSEKKVACQTSV